MSCIGDWFELRICNGWRLLGHPSLQEHDDRCRTLCGPEAVDGRWVAGALAALAAPDMPNATRKDRRSTLLTQRPRTNAALPRRPERSATVSPRRQ